MAVVWKKIAYSDDVITKALLTEQGDVIYASGVATPAALAHGASAGLVLITGGHGANPSWSGAPVLTQVITDNSPITVDDASAADNDFGIFTANGLEGVTSGAALTLLLANVLAENDSIKLDPELSGDGKWSGITRTGLAGATLAFGDSVYYAVGDGRWELTDATVAATSKGLIGICVLAAANDGDATNILLVGIVRAATFPALTAGAPVFLSETAGDITSTVTAKATNVVVRTIGQAWTAEDLWFCPSSDWFEYA
jgi:hypothetical protein